MKLLIVEDDRLLSNALARSLRDAYAVDQAFDGEEGLFYAAQDVYDLVVLDVMLPNATASRCWKPCAHKAWTRPCSC